MPTGYTAKIYDGTEETLAEFLSHLARGMGAYIMQRDEDASEPPKRREVSNYYHTAVIEAQEKVNALLALTDDQKRAGMARDNADAQQYYDESVERYRQVRERYDNRIAEVKALDWPTDAPGVVGEFFTGYKQFVMEQLIDSREFDSHTPTPPRLYNNPDEWFDDQLQYASRSLQFASERLADELDRVSKQNEIHDAFLEFLKQA